MYGLEAINAHNGWAISVVGITIVFSGLVTLSLVISQLHKGIDLINNPDKIRQWFVSKTRKPEVPVLVMTAGQKQVARQFSLLVRTMDDHFSLPRLLRLAIVSGLKEPHANLNMLLCSKVITADGEGLFTWDQDKLDNALSH